MPRCCAIHAPRTEAERKAEIVQYQGVPSLIALLRATHPAFKEQAAAVLANLMYDSPSTKVLQRRTPICAISAILPAIWVGTSQSMAYVCGLRRRCCWTASPVKASRTLLAPNSPG